MRDADSVDEGFMSQEIQPPPSITRELYLAWRSPRLGRSNPEVMTNPVWDWLIRSKISAFEATEQFDGPSGIDSEPGWCFDRFWQSKTLLPDGRVVLISGEHEDHYDPDFFIYNDVVVCHPDGSIKIFGYPRDIFPPTDFHSATLAGDQIIIIGNLGYPETRQPDFTPVFILDLESFAMRSVRTSGVSPGWIHEHSANLSEDKTAILLSGGKLDRGRELGSFVENIDEWKLNLTDWTWERLT